MTATERSENSRVLIIRMIRPPSLLIVSFTTLMWGAGVQMPSPMPQPSHLLSLEREPPHPPPGVLLKSQGRGQQKVRLFGSSTELFLVLILSLPIIKYIHLNTSIPNVTTTTPSPLTNTTPKCTTTEAQARSNTDTPNPSADDTTARVTADAPVHLNTNISNSFVDDIARVIANAPAHLNTDISNLFAITCIMAGAPVHPNRNISNSSVMSSRALSLKLCAVLTLVSQIVPLSLASKLQSHLPLMSQVSRTYPLITLLTKGSRFMTTYYYNFSSSLAVSLA